MDLTLHASFLPQDEPDAAPAFCRDLLGCEVRGDVGEGSMRRITVAPAGQPGTSVVPHPPGVDAGLTEDGLETTRNALFLQGNQT
ncbi:hypothetical protein [Streptomyces sp. WM6386]|uniref:hypothetical protein n=1 Tax=Streptomyces sp. WM6386 TaxID=1415558 RepID=UPI00069738C7